MLRGNATGDTMFRLVLRLLHCGLDCRRRMGWWGMTARLVWLAVVLMMATCFEARASDSTANQKANQKLIVIGFMGGNVSADNQVHRELSLIKRLQEGYPLAVYAAIFANRNGDAALKTVLGLLDLDQDGRLTDGEKSAARIVIFGHSWGASETVALAGRLNRLGIPVLLTIQVDSVQKPGQNDGWIPANVREAVNFYQTEGLLRGRTAIQAVDPAKTTVLGNYESSYRQNPVSCAGYPWYARAFMHAHIMIENDPVVWGRIEQLILARMR